MRARPGHADGRPTMLMMILKRMMMAVPSLIGVVIVTFLLTRALPGDPAAYFAGPAATFFRRPRPPPGGDQADRGKAGMEKAALHPVRPLRRGSRARRSRQL